MSEEKERKIDEEGARQVAMQLGLVEDPEITAYVEALGRRLASYSLRRDVEYVFSVVEMEEPNAFALPGGHIYISRGLLEIANSEAELANVIGHEIGHVTSRHSAQQQTRATAATLFTLLGIAAAAATGQAQAVNAVGQVAALGVPGLLAAYGRAAEQEADRIGQDLTAQAGIDPAGMADFLRTLDNVTRLKLGASRLPNFLDTHPATPKRVAETTTRAQVLHWKPGEAIAPTRAEFLAKLDGMALGKPVKEGLLEGDRLLHPDLGFTVRFPAGWEIQNSHVRVAAVPPGRDAIVILELDGAGTDPGAAATAWAKREGARFISTSPLILGELRAFRAQTLVPGPRGLMPAEITWIAHRGQVYRLSAAAAGPSSRKYAGSFRSFVRSFRSIRDEERAGIRETRLRVAVAEEGETLAELSERTGNTWDLNRTAVSNNLRLGTRLREGQLVKVAIAETYAGAEMSPSPTDSGPAPPPVAPEGPAAGPEADAEPPQVAQSG